MRMSSRTPSYLFFLALLLFASCATTTPRAASVQLVTDAPQALPARFVNRLVIVEARVDGGAPVSFLLDTGSDVTVLDRRLHDELALPAESSAIARGAGGSVNTNFVRGRSLDVGNLHIERPAFLILDLRDFDDITNTRVAGILGLDALEGIALRIDYPARRVEIAASGMFPSHGKSTFPLVKRENLYGLNIQIGESAPVPVLLDTGMSGSVSLEMNTAARLGVSPDPYRRLEWRIGVGGGTNSQVASVPWLRLGGRAIPRVELVLAKPAGRFQGAIGGGLLRFFQVTVDFGNDTIALSDEPTPNVELSRSNVSGARVDFRYEWLRDGVRVESVKSGSPAAQAGLRGGELITAVDGEPVRSIGWRRIRDLLNSPGATARWTVASPLGDAERTLIFTDANEK